MDSSFLFITIHILHGVLRAGVVPVFNKHILTRRVITYTKEDLQKCEEKKVDVAK
jgi:hypothetical protein